MRESAITRLGDRTLSFFYYRKLQFFLKLCNFFNVPLYIQAKKTGRFLHMKEMSLLSITMNWAYGHAPHTGDTFAFVDF